MGSPDYVEAARDLDDIASGLRRKHRCHTAIVYGSRATGDAGWDSDYDVAGFGDVASVERVTGAWRAGYLDLFVYPESKLTVPVPEMLHLRGGKVLFQKERFGDQFLAALDDLYTAGPEALPRKELPARPHWAGEKFNSARRADPEGARRSGWLASGRL